MAEEKDPIVAKFTPQFEGAFLRNVPQKDLTQAEVDRIAPGDYLDAFSPHPLYGTPLYTRVDDGREKKAQERAVAAVEKAAEKDKAE